MSILNKSTKFMFDDEILLNQEKRMLNGYLIATDELVEMAKETVKLDREDITYNFYAEYEPWGYDIGIFCNLHSDDVQETVNMTFEIKINNLEKVLLIKLFEDYCINSTGMNATCLLNEGIAIKQFMSKITYDEEIEMPDGSIVLYFNAPKEILDLKYSDREPDEARITLEFPDGEIKTESSIVTIAPLKDNKCYDFYVVKLEHSEVEALLDIASKSSENRTSTVIDDETEYVVTFSVDGYVQVSVKANSFKDAFKKANDKMSEFEFGIKDAEWSPMYAEKDENQIDYEDLDENH